MIIAKSAVPNAFTLGNLGCGILSLLMTFQKNFMLAAIFVLLAGVMDRYDGRIARFLNVSSELGKELDSLADLVSFGVAPSILIFNINQLGIIGYILVLIFPLAGAYRLARYNISTFDGVFAGVPITCAGMFMALYSLFLHPGNESFSVLTIILMSLFSYLMISKIKFKKV